MKKHKKWLSVCLVVCLIGGLGGAVWYRHKIIEERKLSLIYIPKVVDGTNDFWKSLILGAKMAAKEYNAEIGILAPSEENDVERQNELLKEAIEKKPDAILFSPSSFTESDALLKEAKERAAKRDYNGMASLLAAHKYARLSAKKDLNVDEEYEFYCESELLNARTVINRDY